MADINTKNLTTNVLSVKRKLRFEATGETMSRVNPLDVGNHRIYITMVSDGPNSPPYPTLFFLEKGGDHPILDDSDPNFNGYTYLGSIAYGGD